MMREGKHAADGFYTPQQSTETSALSLHSDVFISISNTADAETVQNVALAKFKILKNKRRPITVKQALKH